MVGINWFATGSRNLSVVDHHLIKCLFTPVSCVPLPSLLLDWNSVSIEPCNSGSTETGFTIHAIFISLCRGPLFYLYVVPCYESYPKSGFPFRTRTVLTSSAHGLLIIIKRSRGGTKRKTVSFSIFRKKHCYELPFLYFLFQRIRKLSELDCHSVLFPKAALLCYEPSSPL
jgi:hypothetical protein